MIYTDVSLDLETLSTVPSTVILSIAAVPFNRFTGEIAEGREWHVDIDSQSRRSISKSTLMWWFEQTSEARWAIIDGQQKAIVLGYALLKLRDYLEKWTEPEKVRVWGNGASFDNAIFADAYEGNTPWKFWNDRCLRTLLECYEKRTEINLKESIPFEGERHGALADARHQAKLAIGAS